MTPSFRTDPRIVLTLDAGGSSFRFSATQGGRRIVETPPVPTQPDDLTRCYAALVAGFSEIRALCPAAPVAISFAFPGPANYPAGIIRSPPNLPAFNGAVPLGPMLKAHFGLPVFINNDGDLFAFGEAIAGFLSVVNDLLANSGSQRQYRNLLGVTFGTGFGGGIVLDRRLLVGDNSAAAETWLLRNKLHPETHAEESVSIRAIRRVYAELTGTRNEAAPDPKTIADIARGHEPGDRAVAIETYRQLGEVAGDAIAQALTLIDGLAVIGGGLANAADLFLPALVGAINDVFKLSSGIPRRLGPRAFDFQNLWDREQFLRGNSSVLAVPGTSLSVGYEKSPLTAIGISCLGTSEAIALGAYVFALRSLDARSEPSS